MIANATTKKVPVKPVRCAIDTRKGTEEGQEQEFSSRDASSDGSIAANASRACPDARRTPCLQVAGFENPEARRSSPRQPETRRQGGR